MGFAMSVLEVLAFSFVGVVGTLLLIIVVVFVIDRLQTGDAIRRNYPVQALSKGVKEAGIWMNTGEGGLSPFHLEGGCDVVFQIGTAKFGVRDTDGKLSDEKLREVAAHENVRMFELKLAQGAKPGKGGILPGEKVTEEIAKIRGLNVGQDWA